MTDGEDRRTVLKILTAVLGGGAAAIVGVPSIGAVVAPVSRRTVAGADGFVAIVPLDALPEDGTPMSASVFVERPRDAWAVLPPTQVGAVFLRRRGDKVVAFTTVCPHLGCQVDYHSTEDRFVCPCHDSAFGGGGEVLSGPSPRPLDELETRVEDGVVEVRYERFRAGTAEKKPA